MSQKTFNWVAGIIFSLVGTVHLIRSILGWNVEIGEVFIPIGVSVVAFLLAGLMAYKAFSLTRKEKEEKNEEIKPQ